MTEQTTASAPLDVGEFRLRCIFTAKDAGTYIIGGKERVLSAGEAIELPDNVSTIWRVSDVPLTITIAG